MSRIETALKPLVENSSSAAARIASRRFGLRAAAVLPTDLMAGVRIIICTIVQKIRSGQQEGWALVLAEELVQRSSRMRTEGCDRGEALRRARGISRRASPYRAFAGACTCHRS